MTTSRAVFLGLLVIGTAGCDLLNEQGKRDTRPTEERSDDAAAIAPPTNVSPTSATTPETTPAATAKTTAPTAKTTAPTAPVTKRDDAPALAPVDTRTLEGIVRAVDAQRRLISITMKGQVQTFPVDAKAPIENLADMSHALKGGLAAIRPGNGVFLVVYRNKSDKEVVSLIRVKGAK